MVYKSSKNADFPGIILLTLTKTKKLESTEKITTGQIVKFSPYLLAGQSEKKRV